jgi:hypothetical protein
MKLRFNQLVDELLKEVKMVPYSYSNTSSNTIKYEPLKDNETIRVYHGFNDLQDFLKCLQHGLSGKGKAKRIYSYEANNNPYGLFVTTHLDVAKRFGMYIVELHVKVSDLESPVWPTGSYVGQGQMSGAWKSPEEREQAQLKLRQQFVNDRDKNPSSAVHQSDRPEVVDLLFNDPEHQALFIGELDPNSVKAVWVSKNPRNVTAPFERMSRKDALKKFEKEDIRDDSDYRHKVLKPRERFDMDLVLDRLSKKYGKTISKREDLLKSFKQLDRRGMSTYLWPQQVNDAWKFLHDK